MTDIKKTKTTIRPEWLIFLTNTYNFVDALDEIIAGAGVRTTTLKRFPNYTESEVELIEQAIDDCLDLEELLAQPKMGVKA